MPQAKTLTQAEIDQVLRYLSTTRYPVRNRAVFLTSVWSGMRVGEIASLRVSDAQNADGSMRAEIRLHPDQTKGRHPRTVFLNQRLREELQRYISHYRPKSQWNSPGSPDTTLTPHSSFRTRWG